MLVLVLAKVPRQLPPQPGDGLQAHLVPAALGVNSQGEEGDGFSAALRLVLDGFLTFVTQTIVLWHTNTIPH